MVARQAGQNQENSADKGARRAWAAIGAPPRRLGLAPQSRQWPATIGERPVTRWVCKEQATKRPEGPQGLAWHMDRVYSHAGSRPGTDAHLANYVSQSNSNCVGFKHLKKAPFPKKLQVKKRSPPGWPFFGGFLSPRPVSECPCRLLDRWIRSSMSQRDPTCGAPEIPEGGKMSLAYCAARNHRIAAYCPLASFSAWPPCPFASYLPLLLFPFSAFFF